MRLKSTRYNAALALLVGIGVASGCGEDPVSEGPPGDFSTAGWVASGGSVSTGGATPSGTGGSTGGRFGTGGTTPAGGTMGTGGTASSTTGGRASGTTGGTASGGKGGTSSSSKGGASATGGSKSAGTGGRSSSGGGGGTTASGSGGKASGGAAVAFSQVGSVIAARCTMCHMATMPTLQNNASLRNTLTTFRVPDCGNDPLITPNDPANSALLQLVNRQCMMNRVMPPTCTVAPCIPAADVTTITNWINAGAPP